MEDVAAASVPNKTKRKVQVNRVFGKKHFIPTELSANIPKRAQTDSDIIGREEDLTKLREGLCQNQSVVLVNGMGGIGKTMLAQAYLDKHRTEYQNIVWVQSYSKNFKQDLITTPGLLKKLKVSAEGREDDIFEAVIAALHRKIGHANLLIIDDAKFELSQYQEQLGSSPYWHVLVTSKDEINGFALQSVDFLPEDAAIALFKQHYGSSNMSDGDIAALVAIVDFHSLTIELLAKTAVRLNMTAAQLIQTIDQDLQQGVYLKQEQQGQKSERVRSCLNSIFHLSFPNKNQQWLLRQFLCLPGEYIPFSRLKYLLVEQGNFVVEEASELSSEDMLFDTLASLRENGWLLHNKESGSYKMHQVVKAVVMDQLGLEVNHVYQLLKLNARLLQSDQGKPEDGGKYKWLSYGKAALQPFMDSKDQRIATLQHNLALRLQDLGDYKNARLHLENALESDKQSFGAHHPTTALCYMNLATVLYDAKAYEESYALIQRAHEIFSNSLSEHHPSVKNSHLWSEIIKKEWLKHRIKQKCKTLLKMPSDKLAVILPR